jgi:predicted RNA-binding Zn-ribbon protein involved in translation (DUF1610 family)
MKKRNEQSKYLSVLQKHEEKMSEFQNKDQKIRNIDSQLSKLEKDFAKLQKKKQIDELENNKVKNNADIYKISDQMQKLRQEKQRVQSDIYEQEYIMNTCQLISRYIELEQLESELLIANKNDESSSRHLHEIALEKNELTVEYYNKVEDDITNITTKMLYNYDNMTCKDCNQIRYQDNIYMVCPDCGNCIISLAQNENPSFKEMTEYEYRPQFTYDKMSHLDDWLRRFQSKENRVIPSDILDKVILEAKKERIKDLNQLSEDKVKRYLKKLSLNEYYDNIIGIINRINGRPPFKLTQEIETKIKMMFSQMQEPYEKFKPKNRKNFLSYSYTLHKIFQILGLHEFSKYFPLLKSADKLRQQDEIFKKIVDYLAERDKSIKWAFYPSF